MKRFIPVAMALALLLAACGEDAPAPTSAQTEAVTPAVTEPAVPSDTPQPERGGLSPTAEAALNELEFLRGSELAGENDERLIRETLTYYFLMRNDMLCERGYDVPDFTTFFDTSSPDYDKLVYNVDKARYFAMLAQVNGSPEYVWYNTTVTFNSLKIDGDTASAEVHDLLDMIYDGSDNMSAQGTTNYVDMRCVDGVWLITDITPTDTFDGAVSHEELLEDIAELEAQLET